MIQEIDILEFIETKKELFLSLSNRVFETPETLHGKYKLVSVHTNCPEEEGFGITKYLCDMPTAVLGEAGNEGPVNPFLGGFDALPGLSQQPRKVQPIQVIKNVNGDNSGHNLLGVTSLPVATAMRDWISFIK